MKRITSTSQLTFFFTIIISLNWWCCLWRSFFSFPPRRPTFFFFKFHSKIQISGFSPFTWPPPLCGFFFNPEPGCDCPRIPFFTTQMKFKFWSWILCMFSCTDWLWFSHSCFSSWWWIWFFNFMRFFNWQRCREYQ